MKLNDAIKSGNIEQFAKEHNVHPERPDGPQRFNYVLGRMVGKTKSEAASVQVFSCLLYTSPSPRDQRGSRMPSSA